MPTIQRPRVVQPRVMSMDEAIRPFGIVYDLIDDQNRAAQAGRQSSDTRFTPRDQTEVDFYERVYFGARFHVSVEADHDHFIITPQRCFISDYEVILRTRLALGIRTGNPPFMPTAWRKKLPREPVEALPLPG